MNELSHHAYLVEGPLALVDKVAANARAMYNFTEEHSPDVVVRSFEKLGVEEAATVRQQATLKSSSGRGLFVVGFSLITSEAQQSLLKLLEEPQKGTVFILVAPHGSLLPTIKSRLLPYPVQQSTQETGQQTGGQNGKEASRKSPPGAVSHGGNASGSDLSRRFLSAIGKDRSTQIAALLKDEEGERERVRNFLNDLEATLYATLPKTKDNKKIVDGLSDIAKVRSYVGDRSPSLKMLLEHLAVALPKI